MAKDIPLPAHIQAVAELSAIKAATEVGNHVTELIREHLELCEARKVVLPNGKRPGLDVRVDRLEQSQVAQTQIRTRTERRRDRFLGVVLGAILSLAVTLAAAAAIRCLNGG